jgi:hypothetical protein
MPDLKGKTVDSTPVLVKDKYLALAFCVFLMLGYFFLLQNAFIENVTLFMVGVLGGLLRSSTTPQGQTVTGDIVEKKEVN